MTNSVWSFCVLHVVSSHFSDLPDNAHCEPSEMWMQNSLYSLFDSRHPSLQPGFWFVIDHFDQKTNLYTMLSSDKDSMESAFRNVSIFDI